MNYAFAIFDLCFAVLMLTFFTTIYYLGVKHGMKLAKGKVPDIKVNPITSIKEFQEKIIQNHIDDEAKKAEDLINEGWYGENGIMNYNPYRKEGE